MAIAHLSDIDVRIRDAVTRQLEWDPAIDASAIGVAAKDGAVTLTGYIDTYAGKLAAERAAKGIRGVLAVANDLEVQLKLERTDTDIAHDVVRSLELRSTVPDKRAGRNCPSWSHYVDRRSDVGLPTSRCGKGGPSTSAACVESQTGSAWRQGWPPVTFTIGSWRHSIAMPISTRVT